MKRKIKCLTHWNKGQPSVYISTGLIYWYTTPHSRSCRKLELQDMHGQNRWYISLESGFIVLMPQFETIIKSPHLKIIKSKRLETAFEVYFLFIVFVMIYMLLSKHELIKQTKVCVRKVWQSSFLPPYRQVWHRYSPYAVTAFATTHSFLLISSFQQIHAFDKQRDWKIFISTRKMFQIDNINMFHWRYSSEYSQNYHNVTKGISKWNT